MDSLSETCISPMKVRSYEKALSLQGITDSVANTASNTNATVAALADIKAQNTQVISLLQQLVDK